MMAFVQANHCDMMKTELERVHGKFFTQENPPESYVAKHTPVISQSGVDNQITVTVGPQGNYHPIVPTGVTVHFINYIYVVDQDSKTIEFKTMNPTGTSPPISATFDVPAGVTKLKVFAYCNLHGLFGSDWFDIPTSWQVSTIQRQECTIQPPSMEACESYHKDFLLRQQREFDETSAYTETDSNKKHIPYITLADDKGSASIIVGVEGLYHPMNGPTHWLTEIWVVDQDDKIIKWIPLDPTGKDKAQVTFDVPAGTTKLTAYVWCNLHGLYKGPTVVVPTSQTSASRVDSLSFAVLTFLFGLYQVGNNIIA